MVTIADLSDRIRKTTIAKLNDEFRCVDVTKGRLMLTAGILALERQDQRAILSKVQAFKDFTEGNDPYNEHDFGSFDHGPHRVIWRIDYYSPDMEHGSEDPADPSVTTRVLTIMLAWEA